MVGSDATAAEDEEQQGNDREDDENGVQHGPSVPRPAVFQTFIPNVPAERGDGCAAVMEYASPLCSALGCEFRCPAPVK